MFVDPLFRSAHISYSSFVLRPSTSTFRLFHSSSFNVLFRFHVSPFVSLARWSSLSHSLVSAFVPRRAFRPNPISIPFPFRQLSLISPRLPSCPSQILSPLYIHLFSPWILMHICMHLHTQVLEINGCLSSFSPRHLPFLLLFYFFILLSLELTSLHPPCRSSASVVNETRVRTDLYLSSMISAAKIISP